MPTMTNKDWQTIKDYDVLTLSRDKSLRKLFAIALDERLTQDGEHILKPKSIEHIFNVFLKQGYWAGVKYRYFFKPGEGFTREPRFK